MSAGLRAAKPENREAHSTMLIHIAVVLIVVGILLWIVNRFIPMEDSVQWILNAAVVIAVILWLLNAFRVFHSVSEMHMG